MPCVFSLHCPDYTLFNRISTRKWHLKLRPVDCRAETSQKHRGGGKDRFCYWLWWVERWVYGWSCTEYCSKCPTPRGTINFLVTLANSWKNNPNISSRFWLRQTLFSVMSCIPTSRWVQNYNNMLFISVAKRQIKPNGNNCRLHWKRKKQKSPPVVQKNKRWHWNYNTVNNHNHHPSAVVAVAAHRYSVHWHNLWPRQKLPLLLPPPNDGCRLVFLPSLEHTTRTIYLHHCRQAYTLHIHTPTTSNPYDIDTQPLFLNTLQSLTLLSTALICVPTYIITDSSWSIT